MWFFCLLDPGQIRYRAIYTHPNQIPGYASGSFVHHHHHHHRVVQLVVQRIHDESKQVEFGRFAIAIRRHVDEFLFAFSALLFGQARITARV